MVRAAAGAVGLASGLGLSGQALAQGLGGGWTPSLEAGLVSDYLFRGVDQTRGRGQAFAAAEFDSVSARAGVFASNVAAPGPSGASTQAEVDLYGGGLTTLAGFDAEAGAIGYVFSGARSRPDLAELYARLGRTLGPARFSATVNYAPLGEHAARDGYVELKADYPLTPKWSVSGAVGHVYASRPEVLDAFAPRSDLRSLNATTWNAGVSYSLNDRIALDLRWSDADHDGPSDPSRVFVTLHGKLF